MLYFKPLIMLDQIFKVKFDKCINLEVRQVFSSLVWYPKYVIDMA